MKKYYLLFTLPLFVLCTDSFAQTPVTGSRMNEVFLKTDLSASNALNDPWEVTYGPDDSLWITESKGYKVYKMHPNGGTKATILDISNKSIFLGTTPGAASDSAFNLQFPWPSSGAPQGGLAGLVIHPDFNKPVTPKKYVYISYIRSYLSTAGSNGGVFYQNRIARFTYNPVTGKLQNPVSVCDTLPGSSDHNSQRMIIAPVNGVYYLFYAAGDMGAGQFANQNRTNNAQKSSVYEGKILRFNLEQDADASSSYDQWIPNDNPYNGAKQSAVWAIGIRNNQGFAYDSVRDILYGSSHGPYSDDEVNIIQPSRNYGHPLVIGFAADNNYNGSSAGTYPSSAVPVITNETAAAAAIGASYKDPIFCGYAQPQATINNIWVTNPGNGTWPSEGWSGLGLYNYSTIPGWKNSLIMAGLKWGRMIRTKLDANGTAIVASGAQDTVCYFDSNNRYRDMAFGPGGKDIYIIMDKSAATSGPSANNPMIVACPGCLQKYTFLGYNPVAGTSSISSFVPIASGKPNICEDINSITIDASNKNLWVPITDTSGNIVAELYPNGNLLGNVTASVYTNTGAVREHPSTHMLYLDRNITITPQNQPSAALPVGLRFYLNNTEYTALKNAINSMSQSSNVNIPADLTIFKNEDACGPAIASGATQLITSKQAAFGAGGYVVQANVSSFSTFYIAGLASLLPLHIISFNGAISNDIGKLKWITEDEPATKTFTLERSINNRDFYPITTTSSGKLSGQQSYTYNDSAVSRLFSPVIYYRLKITDPSDRYSYSAVVTLYPDNNRAPINIHPNPVTSDLTVDVNAAVTEQASWEVTDAAGKTILQHSIWLNKGANKINIHLSKIPAGAYYLKITGNTISQSAKLQKL